METNEMIARWKGWRPSPEGKYCWADPDGNHRCAVVHATYYRPAYPAYTDSLDAQVPVWEALKQKHNLNFELEYAGDTFAARPAPWPSWEYGESLAEAAANAIVAALESLGELE